MPGSKRVTVTLRVEVVKDIDRLEKNRSVLLGRPGILGCLAILWICSGCGDAEPADPIGSAGSQDVSVGGASGASGAAANVPENGGQPVAGGGIAGGSTAGGGAAARTGSAGGTTSGGGGATGNAGKGATGGANSGGTVVAGAGGKAGVGAGASGAGGAGGPLSEITLWIAGDSTVKTYDPAVEPVLEGWGQEIGQFFGDTVTVNNQAIGGRSTRTFMYNTTCVNNAPVADKSSTPAQWGRIKNGIKEGDFLLIQFGHNDAGTVCERHVDLDEYKTNLSDMVDIILAKKATPVLVTPMCTLSYKNGAFTATLTDYSDAMKTVAQSKKLECVDLNTRSIEYYRSVGYEKLTTDIFEPGGNTHFQKEGAIAMAGLVTEELRAMGSPLARHLR